LEDVNYSSLIKDKSTLIPTFVRDIKDLFHVHVGFFSPAAVDVKRLINVNVDALDIAVPSVEPAERPVKRSVGIYTMAQDQMVDPSQIAGAESIYSNLTEQHDALKALLGDVISAETAERIGLAFSGETK